METKNNEVVEKTSDLKLMEGKYLSERLLRSWKEDFVDEDTSEVVTIDRNEVIMQKGTFLTSKEISEINFFLQSGDIKEVSVSNQQRSCHLTKSTPSVWVAKIKLNGKAKNIYMYADSLITANNICIDFSEQKYEGNFKFLSIKELEYSTLISLNLKDDNVDEGNTFYKIEVEVVPQNEEAIEKTFIINGSNADSSKSAIIEYLSINDETLNNNFEVIIISAKKIPCNDIVDVDFSRVHMNY